jgi:hypothetical protein
MRSRNFNRLVLEERAHKLAAFTLKRPCFALRAMAGNSYFLPLSFKLRQLGEVRCGSALLAGAQHHGLPIANDNCRFG